ncbi:xanthine dehydrogenase family protein molybdopterin-binding subunit [Mucilaginibacter arboris]|uniref:Molybdopterin-dependent oxidoreductase n=1 Tax=Mucilaginibacter arboris TaxID=2682090 RepID=A0A7K1SYJ9_9SPHI|nr:xanthine dehydrogenase family protein molybdopterin-binding subunit [Mucilaginibacter arboris]MVN22395.1 molybdopterin-dependent oxidoreductase [Mucilaginibacter arboris]
MKKQDFFNLEAVEAMDRVDGRLKVTGAARYSAEFPIPKLTYGVLATSTIASGKIQSLDTKKAERAPGVLAVISHFNAPKIPGYSEGSNPAKGATTKGQPLRIFSDDIIMFYGQPIALVVADTLERAQFAAGQISAQYQKADFQTDFDGNVSHADYPAQAKNRNSTGDYVRGEVDAYKKAPVKIEAEYVIPTEVHNPMELQSIIAVWDAADKVTVYDKTQSLKGAQGTIAQAFKIPAENVQVVATYVGGAFGNALRTWPHEIAAVMAAQKVGRPVKLVVNREQMFTMVGYRPYTWQKVSLGATADGKLVGISHEVIGQTSAYEEFTEGTVNVSKFLYACPNVNTSYKILPLNVSTPTWMRGPGEASGAFALDCAMDELAYQLNLDPIELRLRNHADIDPERNLPWSSKYLKECYQEAAQRIGWFKRNPKPRSMQSEDGMLVGYGMGTGSFSAGRSAATASIQMSADGTYTIQCATTDIGPGTATAMVQIASDVLQVPADKIKFQLGNSSFPKAPSQGGSSTVSTVGSAVTAVCVSLKQKLAALAAGQGESAAVKPADLVFENGKISSKDQSINISYTDVLKKHSLPSLDATEESRAGAERQKYSFYSFSVHFVEVHVHPATGQVRVKRVVSCADAGKIINQKTAGSQVIGGAIGGIGMALMEEAIMDNRFGRYVNNNFADYHVPVHADIPHIDAVFIDKKDPYINPMGSKGVGEISLIGMAAAVANAVFHATGKRVRDLPITPDKLI